MFVFPQLSTFNPQHQQAALAADEAQIGTAKAQRARKNPKPFTLNLIPTGRALLPQRPIIFSFGVQCSMFRLLAP